ncbi:MAG: ABC transporter substrate-binding protein [Candidatus Hydrogenedentes bacterium]|nr:ABC transporter substrate-binding protein [Candidatus Hydrogenedentota bacterium]
MRALPSCLHPLRLSLAILIALAPASFAAQADAPAAPQRIVSLAPSTTEILFELGLGERIVGVTRYCDHPEAAKNIRKLGGYIDPSYEEIVALQADLAILLTSHHDAKRELTKMAVPTLITPHDTVADIHEAIRLIGEACGVPDRAAAMIGGLTHRSEAIRRAVAGKPRPRVLICVGRDINSDQLAGMYMAGRNGLYDELIEAAGGINAYRDTKVAYPQISAEGVIELDPDVIIDLVSHIEPDGRTAEQIARQWAPLRVVPAVRNNRVHVIIGTHALRPGPRYILLLEQLARLLHPDAFREEAAHE